jgi:hypothetical protein
MGGWGSGPRRPHGTKRTVERCPAISLRWLQRRRLLQPGDRAGAIPLGAESEVGYRLSVGPAGSTLRLRYTVVRTGERLDYQVQLVTTPCHFGGSRYWLVCPLASGGVACGRRVAKLYLHGRYFGCRKCQNLSYRSTQASDRRVYAAVRRGQHLEMVDSRWRSVRELAFTLKLLRFRQHQLDKLSARIAD